MREKDSTKSLSPFKVPNKQLLLQLMTRRRRGSFNPVKVLVSGGFLSKSVVRIPLNQGVFQVISQGHINSVEFGATRPRHPKLTLPQVFHGGKKSFHNDSGFPKATKILELSLNYSELRHRLGKNKLLQREREQRRSSVL